tara:strand:+ start:975 stop:1493 length:519 start_codon:yes stop_codon:yes gene_type:complete
MATVVHRKTLQVIYHANTPDFPSDVWVVNPVIPDAPKRHWKSPITGDSISLKSQTEKDEADAKYLQDEKDAKFNELEQEFTDTLESIYPTGRQIWLTKAASDAKAQGLTDRLAYINTLWDWINYGAAVLFAAQDAMKSKESVEEVNAVSLDLADWLSSDPKVSIRTVGGVIS